jgi:nitroreductase
MNKNAQIDHPIHELLRSRWSPRSFANRPVEPEKLLSLFEAARWAPSSGNAQPWNFIVATKDNPAEHERLLNCLMDGNIRWAKNAPVLMFSVAQLQRKDRPNRHAFHDVGQAVAHLTVQAMALDLYVHQMGGFHQDKARQTFQIPETHEPVAAIAVGYLGPVAQLPEDLQEREQKPGERKALTEFVFSGAWGQVTPLLEEG